MPQLDSYDHRTGSHCGAAALRNVGEFYNWTYDEAECFGLGAGLVFDLLEHPSEPWPVPRASAAWTVPAFFDNLDVPHFVGEGDEWEGAWNDVADTIDGDDPAILFLDADSLGYLPDEDAHSYPHVVVAVGYDDGSVTVSDATVEDLQSLSLDDLREAWTIDGLVSHERRYVTVTRARTLQDDETAAARSINQVVDYFHNALDAPRTTGAPGTEGHDALESFAAELPAWSDHDDPQAAAASVVRALDWHGDRAAFRDLYAEALAELAPRAGLGGGWRDQLTGVAEEWRSVVDLLADVADGEADPDVAFEEAGSQLGAVVDREDDFFDQLNQRI